MITAVSAAPDLTRRAPALVFDISTLARRADRRPTGIERTILEIAVVLCERSDVAFCELVSSEHRYREVNRDTVVSLSKRIRGSHEVPTSKTSQRMSRGATARRLVSALDGRVLRKVPLARPHLRRAGSHALRAAREVARLPQAVGTDLRDRRRGVKTVSEACFSDMWTQSTTYCSVGMDWLHNDLGHLEQAKSVHRFRVALMVHDLLPEVAPQYSGVDSREYFLCVHRVANVVVVNSDATEADLRWFAEAHGLTVPPVVQLPMGSALLELDRIKPTLPNGDPIPERYVLCVGTVTIRKNHQLLFDVWEELITEHGPDNTPPLIVAGAKGWLSDETMSRLTRTPAFAGIVHHIANATDENIAWLYANCTFTVYPSLYEGWGLPVSESHDFGKVCLTTTTSSLPEAGEGLAELLDPHDRSAWREHIWTYWTNDEYRTNRERHINTHHHHTTATESANTIHQVALR